MSPTLWGATLGALFAGGVLLVAVRVRVIRRPQLALRVLPYVRDLPQVGRSPALRVASSSPTSAAAGVFGPVLRSAADAVERVLGGATSVRRRLERANLDKTVHEFRVEQVLWGVVAFAVAAAFGVLRMLTDPGSAIGSLVGCGIAFVVGVLARDTWLTSQVRSRERRILAEFPTVAELLALAVAAGEGPVGALDRVVRRSGGELSADLARVLADIRTGEPVGAAFDAMASATGLPLVARFAQGIAVAVERGTPLADVLHAQAADVREAGRRELIETAARKEVFMMVPSASLSLSNTATALKEPPMDLFPKTTAPCPTWCTLPPGHGYDLEHTFERTHIREREAGDGATRTGVDICAGAEAAGDGGAEVIDTPGITIWIVGNAVELPGHEWTADEARTIADQLHAQLHAAADDLDAINAGEELNQIQ